VVCDHLVDPLGSTGCHLWVVRRRLVRPARCKFRPSVLARSGPDGSIYAPVSLVRVVRPLCSGVCCSVGIETKDDGVVAVKGGLRGSLFDERHGGGDGLSVWPEG
jgi:hypothetical protein